MLEQPTRSLYAEIVSHLSAARKVGEWMFRISYKLLIRFLLILLGVSLISFLLMYLAPGDPAKNMLAAQGIPLTKELLEAKRLEFGFQDPFWVQYGRWLWESSKEI